MNIENKGKGLRYNKGKLRYDLVNPFAHEQMVKILTLGIEKYAERNWELGMKWSDIISSLKRHLAAIEKGEDYDLETGELHAAHLACNAHFLTAYYKLFPQGDDRPHSYLKQPKIGLDIDEVLCDWVGGWCERFGYPIPTAWNFSYNNSEHFKELIDNPEELRKFYLGLKPKINADDIPFEPHAYITSRTVPVELTKQWLQQNGFPTAPVYCVDFGHSKIDVAKQSGIDIFVDDRFDNFVELNNAGICCYLWDAKHNQRYDVGFRRIYSLKELV